MTICKDLQGQDTFKEIVYKHFVIFLFLAQFSDVIKKTVKKNLHF